MGQYDTPVLWGVVQWRHLLLLAGAFQGICTSVIIYGFPQLESVLLAEGVYSGSCGDEEAPCDAQFSSLALIFVVGSSLTTCAAIVNGLIMDNFGIRKAAFVSNALMLLAFTILTAAAWTDTEELYLPGFAIMGAGGIGMLHVVYSVTNLFPGNESMALGILNGTADASAVVFLIMNLMYSGGIPLHFIFLAYLVGPLGVTFLFACFLWPEQPFPQQQLPDTPPAELKGGGSPMGAGQASKPMKQAPPPTTLVTLPSEEASSEEAEKDVSEAMRQAWGTGTAPPTPAHTSQEESDTPAEVHAAERARRRKLLATMSRRSPAVARQRYPYLHLGIWDQLRSPLFLAFTGFGVTCLFKFNFYMASINAHLAFLGQDDSGVYTTVFGVLLFVGAAAVPFTGRLVDSSGLHVAVAMLTALSTALTIITVIPVLALQVLGFVILVLFRGTIFTLLAAVLSQEFGFPTLGRTLGLVSLVGGLAGLLISPLFDWSLSANGGNFIPAHFIVGGIGLLQIVFAVGYWRYRVAADTTGIAVALTLSQNAVLPQGEVPAEVKAPVRTQPAIQMVPV